jgi:predicted kinase
MTDRTYAELFKTTADLLARKCSVLVDASFAGAHERRRFIALAEQLGRPVWLLHLECPDELTLARLDRRSGDASDGRRELFARQKADFNQITATGRVVPVDTSRSVDYNVQSILCRALAKQERSP